MPPASVNEPVFVHCHLAERHRVAGVAFDREHVLAAGDGADARPAPRSWSIVSVLSPLPVRSMRSMPSSFAAASGLLRSSVRPAPSSASVSVPPPPSASRNVEVADGQLVVAGAAVEHIRAAAAGQQYRRPARRSASRPPPCRSSSPDRAAEGAAEHHVARARLAAVRVGRPGADDQVGEAVAVDVARRRDRPAALVTRRRAAAA